MTYELPVCPDASIEVLKTIEVPVCLDVTTVVVHELLINVGHLARPVMFMEDKLPACFDTAPVANGNFSVLCISVLPDQLCWSLILLHLP